MEHRILPIAGGLATASLFGCLVKRSHFALRPTPPSPPPRPEIFLYLNVGRLLALKCNLADSERLQEHQKEPGVETPSTDATSQCPGSNDDALLSQHVGQLARRRHSSYRSGIQQNSAREFLPGVIQFWFHAQALKRISTGVLLGNLPAGLGHFSESVSGNLTTDVTNLSPRSSLTLYF